MPLIDPSTGYFLVGILNSRVIEYYCRKVFAPKANGYYEIQPARLEELPVPRTDEVVFQQIGTFGSRITELAKSRYALHERARNRIRTDLAPPENQKLNQKLTRWWELDFPAFREQIKRHLKQEIPVAERDQWQDWLDAQRAEHDRLTAEIIRLETELNDHVYTLFDLTEDEIALIEEVTKYEYGEV
jgi:hypothetical protein